MSLDATDKGFYISGYFYAVCFVSGVMRIIPGRKKYFWQEPDQEENERRRPDPSRVWKKW